MMRNESKSRPNHANANWQNQTRSGESFKKFKLFNANLTRGTFENCNFSICSAKGAKFVKANLSGSIFRSANLEHANFTGANLQNADFQDSQLKGTDFTGANTEGAKFAHSNYEAAKGLRLSAEQLAEIEEANRKSSVRKIPKPQWQEGLPAETINIAWLRVVSKSEDGEENATVVLGVLDTANCWFVADDWMGDNYEEKIVGTIAHWMPYAIPTPEL